MQELITGLGPLPAEQNKRSSFLVALAQSLWYVSDGRPYDELAAASGLAFGFCARPGAPRRAWPEAVVDAHLETLGRATGMSLRYLELADEDLPTTEPQRAWSLLADQVEASLEERRPPLVRGGWPGPLGPSWGAVTGYAPGGLPLGHIYDPERGQAVPGPTPLEAPPTQMVLLTGDIARPAAGALARRIVADAAEDLRGAVEVVRAGRAWRTGAHALEAWGNELAAGPQGEGGGDAAGHRVLALTYSTRRRWAARYLAQTAGLQLGQVRATRALSRRFAELAGRLDDWADASALAARLADDRERAALAAVPRELADRERALADELAELSQLAGEPR